MVVDGTHEEVADGEEDGEEERCDANPHANPILGWSKSDWRISGQMIPPKQAAPMMTDIAVPLRLSKYWLTSAHPGRNSMLPPRPKNIPCTMMNWIKVEQNDTHSIEMHVIDAAADEHPSTTIIVGNLAKHKGAAEDHERLQASYPADGRCGYVASWWET